MKKVLYTVLAATLLTACTSPKPEPSITFTVSNPLGMDRVNEIVEIDNYASIKDSLALNDSLRLVILDAQGHQVAYQLTDNLNSLIFPATVSANGTATYTFKAGTPDTFTASVFGQYYAERVDDIAWENEYSAYRLYGPALQASGERAFGYDVWCKSVSTPVIDGRYRAELDSRATVDSLNAAGKKDEAAALIKSVSYHVDHGNGLDCYKVGPTLGGGTAALIADGKIVYPYCYKAYEILENGPLRFTVKLDYGETVVKGDTVVEHRILSAEAGSRLNRCAVLYAGLKQDAEVATGLVIHPENVDSMAIDNEAKFIAYADLTDNVNNGNGTIYVGAVCPGMKEGKAEMFSAKEAKNERGDAAGHVLAISDYKPATFYTYYFGSSWSKYDMPDMEAWKNYLSAFSEKVAHPLVVQMN